MHKSLLIALFLLFNYSFSSALTLDEIDDILKKNDRVYIHPQEGIQEKIAAFKKANDEEAKKFKQEVRDRVIWAENWATNTAEMLYKQLTEKLDEAVRAKDNEKHTNKKEAVKPESIGHKTNYAYRFAFLPEYSSIRKSCSTVNESKRVNDACATLSNFLYCAQHPYRVNRPAECQEFCKDYLPSNKYLKRTLLILQKELHLDPKEIIDFTQHLMQEIEAHKSPELCSSYGLEHLKALAVWFSKKVTLGPRKPRNPYEELAC